MGLYDALSKLEEEEKLRAYYARVNRGKRRRRSSGYGPDTHTADQLRVARTAVTQKEAMGSLGQGLKPEGEEYKPSDVDPNITPGSKTDTWAMTKGGTGMRQTLHDPNPQRFMPPGYFAHLQNMQNMAAFPGQVRGGGMPRRQKRHEEEWAAFDQNVADRRQHLGQMNNMRKLQWLQQNAPAAIPEFMRWLKQQ
jgi:hypothetical protein